MISTRALLTFAALTVAASVNARELVTFPAADGATVTADDLGDGAHAVVLAHGGRFDRRSWAEQIPPLIDAGLRVVAIDFRQEGRDEAAHLDVLAAVRYLQEAGAERISLVGASFGGWAVARAVTELAPGTIDGVVLLAHSPIERPEAIHGRKLFVTTREDFSGSGTLRLPAIRDQYERSPEPKELVVLEGSAHAQHVFATDQGPRLMEQILRFLTDDASRP